MFVEIGLVSTNIEASWRVEFGILRDVALVVDVDPEMSNHYKPSRLSLLVLKSFLLQTLP